MTTKTKKTKTPAVKFVFKVVYTNNDGDQKSDSIEAKDIIYCLRTLAKRVKDVKTVDYAEITEAGQKKDCIGKTTWTGPELVKAGGLYAGPQARQKTEQFEFSAIIDETTKKP